MSSLFLLEIIKKYHLKIRIYLSCREKKLSDTFWEFLYYQTLRKDQNLSVLVQSVLRCDRGGWGNAEYSSGWRAGPPPTLQYHLLTQQSEKKLWCFAQESLRHGKKSSVLLAPMLPGAELAPKTNPARSSLKLLPDGKNSIWRQILLPGFTLWLPKPRNWV